MIATREARCRHGVFTYHSDCRFLGASLRIYGEWSEDEVRMYKSILKPTDTVIEIGANIGALTVPLSRHCKKVFAFEPQSENYKLLEKNLIANDVQNVEAFPIAIGSFRGEVAMPTLKEVDADHGVIGDYGGPEVGFGSLVVLQHTLDSLKTLRDIAFIKMDCEGSERDVLVGGEKLIARDKPILYMENNRPEKSDELISWLYDHEYQCYWHRPPVFEPTNFRNYQDNIFGDCTSPNMLCISGHSVDPIWLHEPVRQ